MRLIILDVAQRRYLSPRLNCLPDSSGKIVDALPKPEALAQDFRQGQMKLSIETALALRQYGFFLTQTGRILASDGEMSVEMSNGVNYQIRFGDVAPSTTETGKTSNNRYVFVTTIWDPARAVRYGDTSGAGEKSSNDLNARFSNWFYSSAASNSRFPVAASLQLHSNIRQL